MPGPRQDGHVTVSPAVEDTSVLHMSCSRLAGNGLMIWGEGVTRKEWHQVPFITGVAWAF